MICSACDFDADATVYGQYTMIIPVSAQSLNEVGINNSRNNWKYKKARAAWEHRFSKYVGRIPKAYAHRNMFMTRFYRTRKRDYDYGNLVGGFKPGLDMLVKHGFLLGDQPKHCSEYYRQYPAPDGRDHVIVVLQDTQPREM